VLRGNPNRVTPDMVCSMPPPEPDFVEEEMHSATSPRPGERAKCSAWAKALGKPGDCVRPDGPEVGAEQPKFKRIGANKSSDSSRLPRR